MIILIFLKKFFTSYVSITPRNLQTKFCIRCIIRLSTSTLFFVSTKFRYISFSKMLITWIFASKRFFLTSQTLCRQNHISYISRMNEDFLLHFAAIRNLYFTLCVSAIFYFYRFYFYLCLSLLYRIKTMTLFRFRIFSWDSSWFFMYFIFLVHPAQFFYFWNTYRDLSVAEMLKFCLVTSKKICLNVFMCIFFYYSISFSFTVIRIEYCFMIPSTAYREHSSSTRKKLIFSYIISLQRKHKIKPLV